MAVTSARLLRLLSLLGARASWSGADLAAELGVGVRTLRRDVDSLRALGYPVGAGRGPGAGHRLGSGGRLPPLLLDEQEALAVAVALQTAPATVQGIDDAVARALRSILQVVPAHLRSDAEALHVTTLRNYGEFPAPPLPAAALRDVAGAVRRQHLLRVERLRPDGSRPHPHDDDFVGPVVLEPHHLVVWAARWYVVAHVPDLGRWQVLRLDGLHPLAPTGQGFARRELPGGDVAELVMTTPDRGDTPADWPCRGRVVLALPAAVVARFAPGGSVVEAVTDSTTRLHLGAWSWAGIAGLVATFDAEVSQVEPAELRRAAHRLGARLAGAAVPAAAPAGEVSP